MSNEKIIRALSLANIGKAPADSQLHMAQAVLCACKTEGVLNSFSLDIKQINGIRVMTVSWSALHEFSTQKFSTHVSHLIEENMVVFEVMES